MKLLRNWLPWSLLMWLATSPVLAEPAPGLIVLPSLTSLESQAKESVTISLDATLLATAVRFLDTQTPEDREVRDLVTQLRGIYVRSYKFEHTVTYPTAAIDSIRRQLQAACWQSIVSVRKSREESAVDIYVCQIQQRARGLAIIATEPRELTIVNIVGTIDLDKLHRLEGHFGIPRIPQG